MARKQLNIKLDEKYKEKLRKIAEKNDRSMNKQVIRWIKNTEVAE